MNPFKLNSINTNPRPKLKIEKTTFDIFLEVIAFIGLVYLWFLVYKNYSSLPEIISTHFNSAGQADDFGSKSFLFVLPGIGTLIYILMTVLNNYPHTFNYLVEITEENAKRQYALALRMIRFLKADVIVIFAFITSKIIQDAASSSSTLGVWFVPAFLAITFLPIFLFIVKMFQNK